MISQDVFIEKLTQLVSIPSISPIPDNSIGAINLFLAAFGAKQVRNRVWSINFESHQRLGVYCHIDTKPVGNRAEWSTNPFCLTNNDNKLIGLGVSDSKFQVLTVLTSLINTKDVAIIIDGEEESGGSDAAKFINELQLGHLIVVDGFSDHANRIYDGCRGQLDGTLELYSGEESVHPGKKISLNMFRKLNDLYSYVSQNNLHFNLTGISSESRERSLTLEHLNLKFDLRFNEMIEAENFIDNWAPINVKQFIKPLCGTQSTPQIFAQFSMPLSNHLMPIPCISVIPGGKLNNKNHHPNEFIETSQIKALHENLQSFLSKLK